MEYFVLYRHCSYLQKELCPMSQIVSKNCRVEGFHAFFIQPVLTAGAILVQLLKVWPSGHLNRDMGGDWRRQRSGKLKWS